jgi:hypothetical protein
MPRLLLILAALGFLMTACGRGPTPPAQPAPQPFVQRPAAVVAQPQPGAVPGGDRPDRGLELRAKANEIPQLDEPWDLYAQLSSKDQPAVQDAVLVCEFRLPGKPSLLPWTRPDPLVKLRVAGGREQLLAGRNNREAFAVTAPLPALNDGDRIAVAIEDRDLLTRNDPIDSAAATFDGGLPVELNGAKVHGSCKVMPADEVERRRAEAERWVEQAAKDWVQGLRIVESARDFGYPWDGHAEFESALDGYAGLKGWDDASMIVWRKKFADGRSDFTQRATAAVRDRRSRATAAGTPLDHGGHRIQVVQRLCGEPAKRALQQAGKAVDVAPHCIVGLKLERAPGQSKPWSGPVQRGIGEHALAVVLPDGRTQPLRFEAAVDASGPTESPSVAPGETAALIYAADAWGWGRGAPLEDGVMLRVGGSPPAWLALP